MLFCASVLLGQSAQNGPAASEESHGTINILLANENGLVAVTDSMLSTPDDRHYPGHQKLFQIDDQTIATMAGSYSRPGLGVPNHRLDLWVPNIMTRFALQQRALSRSNQNLPYASKFERFEELFAQALTANLQAAIVADPTLKVPLVEPIELTLAGFDLDGSLKVGEVTLTPKLTPSGVEFGISGLPRVGQSLPTCELRGSPDQDGYYGPFGLPRPRVVGKGLFCEIAGLISTQPDGDIAQDEGVPLVERILNARSISPEPLALRAYYASETSDQPLSIEQLADLARALEDLVARQEAFTNKQRIGGEKYLAILHRGIVEGAPVKNEIRQNAGTALIGPKVFNSGADCTGMSPGTKGFSLDGPADNVQVGIAVTNCDVDLVDGAIYHDSKFINGNLLYSGAGPLHFAGTNTVQGTTLKLNESVDLKRGDVRDLICNFPWKAVYQGSNQVQLACTKK
jgi:hypothetical protein